MDVVDQFISYLRTCYAPEHVVVKTPKDWPLQAAAAKPLPAATAATVAATVALGDADFTPAMPAQLVGQSPTGERLAIVEHTSPEPSPAPSSFRVLAIIPTFNEADVIAHTLQYLLDDHIDVHVLDNWSTDSTVDIVRDIATQSPVTIERFPADGRSDVYDVRSILRRVEELATTVSADWIVLHDADERRRSPWPGIGLRDGLYHVDRAGFTCIDHITLNFWPVDNGYDSTVDLESHFAYFEFSAHAGHFHQRRAWKHPHNPVCLAPSAGHDVVFPGRRVYPFRFLLKHYPIRSQAHGERKVLHERQPRFSGEERSLGWHQQYEQIERFVRDPRDLHVFEPATFYERWFIERLSGIGVFDCPPAWATPPTWSVGAAA